MTNIININAADIRLAKPIVLQRLTGIQSANFCHWSQDREMNTKTIRRIAESLNTSPGEIMEGFRLRRIDSIEIRKTEAKLNDLIAIKEPQQKTTP